MSSPDRVKFSRKLGFFLVYSLGLFFFTIALDRLIVARFIDKEFDDGLIFKPFTKIDFQTIEYKYKVYTNSYGFRDVPNRKKLPVVSKKIMVIGDSFSYGWGVEVEDSWPKVLEKILIEKGFDLRVDILAKPGAGPNEYAEIAEKAIPILKPNIVIVGLLQGDDLAQAKPDEDKPEVNAINSAKGLKHTLARYVRLIYPYISSLLKQKFTPVIKSSSIHQAWQVQAEQTYLRFNPEQKARFNLLDDEVKRLFFAGELNPAVIHIAITNPDYFLELEDLEHPKTIARVKELSRHLERIKNIAFQNQAKVIVVSVPHRIYVSKPDFNTPKRFGFHLDEKMLSSNSMDQALAQAAQENGLYFVQFTERFRSASQKKHLFFALDGHLNPAGHKLFGQLLAPLIEQNLTTH